MSFLSFLGSGLTTTHLLSQIYRRPEFTSFLKNLTDKSTSIDTLHQFIRNFLLTNLDPIVVPLLTTTENKNIFKNKNLTKLEQSKLFFGKLLNHLLNYVDNFESNPANTFSFVAMSLSLGFVQGLKEQKNEFIEQGIATLNHMPELETVTSPTDVYRIVIDQYSKFITIILHSLMQPTYAPAREKDLLDLTCDIMGSFNSVYEYASPIYKNDDNNDSSSSSDTDPVPNKLKRGRAMENLPKPPTEDKQDESKKPKK